MAILSVLLVLATLLIGVMLLRNIQTSDIIPMRQVDVYADQMQNLERDLAKGVLEKDEFESMRAEVGRRIISAVRLGPNPEAAVSNTSLRTLVTVSLAAFILGALIYDQIGRPNVPDSPISVRYKQSDALRTARLGQLEAEAQAPAVKVPQDPSYLQLVTKLRAALEGRPNDIHGFVLLAKSESRLGNYTNAHAAQAQVLKLKGKASSPDEWYRYAELLIMAADTYISKEAEDALRQTLQRDPKHSLALFRIGIYFDQIGRPDRTFNIWRKLLEAGPESASYMPIIRRTIIDLAMMSGVDYEPPKIKGPSREDIQDAAETSEEDRQAMISSMVTGLADRLKNEGGPASDWAQLIVAYGVLGETDTAQETLNNALQLFSGQPADIRILQQASISAGLSQ